MPAMGGVQERCIPQSTFGVRRTSPEQHCGVVYCYCGTVEHDVSKVMPDRWQHTGASSTTALIEAKNPDHSSAYLPGRTTVTRTFALSPSFLSFRTKRSTTTHKCRVTPLCLALQPDPCSCSTRFFFQQLTTVKIKFLWYVPRAHHAATIILRPNRAFTPVRLRAIPDYAAPMPYPERTLLCRNRTYPVQQRASTFSVPQYICIDQRGSSTASHLIIL